MEEIIKLIDFTKCEEIDKDYGGSVRKKAVIYKDEIYMLKLQEKGETHYKNHLGLNEVTYLNSIFSEYIASQIGNNIGLDVHSTILGFTEKVDKTYNVVACKDFLKPNEELFTFRYIVSKNLSKILKEEKNININTLSGTLKAIEYQDFFDPEILKEFFLEMFVFDAYIGNFDRNPTNWGIIKNKQTGFKKIAPIFDNASCLHPKTPRKIIAKYLNDVSLIEDRAIFMPSMTFRSINNERLQYHHFFQTSNNKDFLYAVNKIVPKIIEKHEENKKIILKTPCVSQERKDLLIKELDLRLKNILLPTFKRSKKPKNKIDEKINDKLKKLEMKFNVKAQNNK